MMLPLSVQFVGRRFERIGAVAAVTVRHATLALEALRPSNGHSE